MNLTNIFRIKLQLKDRKSFIYIFISLYSIIILFLCKNLSIWGDESCSLYTSNGSIITSIKLSYHFEGQPPAYFILLTLWRQINDGIFFARLLSVIFIFLSAFLIDRISKLIFKTFHSRFIVILFLLNPYTIFACLEIRLYSFLIFLTLSALYYFYKIYYFKEVKYRYLFALICLVGTYTQYFFVFFIISLGTVLLISKGWRIFFNYVLLQLIVAILFLPNFLFLKEQYNMHQNTQIEYTLLNRLEAVLITIQQFFIGIIQFPGERLGRWLARLITIILLLISLNKIYKNSINYDKDLLSRILELHILIIIFLLILTTAFAFSNLIYDDRYSTIAFPVFCILYISFNSLSKVLKSSFYGILGIYFMTLMESNYRHPYVKYDDHKSVANYIKKIEMNGEPIVFHDRYLTLIFKHYYHGKNDIIPIPKLTFDYNSYKSDIRDTLELNNEINGIKIKTSSFILVTGNDIGFVEKKELTNELIDKYLRKNYKITIDTTFIGNKLNYDLRVRRLFKK